MKNNFVMFKDAEARNKFLDTITNFKEVLTLAGNEISTLPDGEHVSMRELSVFYGVDYSTIQVNKKRFWDEYKADGSKRLSHDELKEYAKRYFTDEEWAHYKNQPGFHLITLKSAVRFGLLLSSTIARKFQTELMNIEIKEVPKVAAEPIVEAKLQKEVKEINPYVLIARQAEQIKFLAKKGLEHERIIKEQQETIGTHETKLKEHDKAINSISTELITLDERIAQAVEDRINKRLNGISIKLVTDIEDIDISRLSPPTELDTLEQLYKKNELNAFLQDYSDRTGAKVGQLYKKLGDEFSKIYNIDVDRERGQTSRPKFFMQIGRISEALNLAKTLFNN